MTRLGRSADRAGGLLLACLLLPFAVVSCGIGWLYLLRSADLLAAGPPVQGALALKQLALADAQPLLRVLAAWLVTGLAAGAVLGALAGRRAKPLLIGLAAGSALLLVVAGAASDALANNERLVAQLTDQLSVPALAVALGTILPASVAGVLGSLALTRRSRARTPMGAGGGAPGRLPGPACNRSRSRSGPW
jgi:hypothetical protein